MFQRFTPQAREAVVLAQEEVRRLRHDRIGGEHLLLGLVRVEPDLVPVAVERIREQVIATTPAGGEASPGTIRFSAEAKRALELGLREALDRKHAEIAPAHLLLGLLAADHRVGELLADLGVGERVREHAEGLAAGWRAPVDPEQALLEGDPVSVTLGPGHLPLGDLGNPAVDVRLLRLMLVGDTHVGRWLRERGIDEAAIRAAWPGVG